MGMINKTKCPVCGEMKVTVMKFDRTGMITKSTANKMQYHCANCGSGSKMHFSQIDLDADKWWGEEGGNI